jgi:hypothetical protein
LVSSTVIASHRLGAKRRPVSDAIHSRVRRAMDCFVAYAPRNEVEDPEVKVREPIGFVESVI